MTILRPSDKQRKLRIFIARKDPKVPLQELVVVSSHESEDELRIEVMERVH